MPHASAPQTSSQARTSKKVWRAALIGAAFLAAGLSVAAAEQWVAADGRLQVTVPNNWPVDLESEPTDAVQQIIMGTADQECRVYTVPNPGTAAATTQQMVRAFAQPFTVEQWGQVIAGVPIVRGGTVTNPQVDSAGFWPRQEAQISTDDGVVYASIQGRAGYDIYAFCKTYGGPDQPAVYNTVLDSIGAATDAAAEAAAAAAAVPTTP